MRIARTLQELDAAITEVNNAARAGGDAAFRDAMSSFSFQPDLSAFKAMDPASREYRDKQLELYNMVAGKQYHTDNEAHPFDPELAARKPFPYMTDNPPVIGDHLMAIGHVISTIPLKRGMKVLELGVGWGNLTLELAKCGAKVTALDVERRYVDLVRKRAKDLNLEINVVEGKFLEADRLGTFDMIIFFESFHHCDDPHRLLGMLEGMLAPGGSVVFAGEPIRLDMPLPWGLRMDSLSVWFIRQKGWLELGFNENYFLQTLYKRGWTVKKNICHSTEGGTNFVARRADGIYFPGQMAMAPAEDATWAVAESIPNYPARFTRGDSVITLDPSPRWKRVRVEVGNFAPFPIKFTLKSGVHRKTFDHPSTQRSFVEIEYDPSQPLKIEAPIWNPKKIGLNANDDRDLGVSIHEIRLA